MRAAGVHEHALGRLPFFCHGGTTLNLASFDRRSMGLISWLMRRSRAQGPAGDIKPQLGGLKGGKRGLPNVLLTYSSVLSFCVFALCSPPKADVRAAGDAFGGRWVPAHQSCLTFFACLVYYLYADSGPNITYHFVLPIPRTLDVRYLLCLCVCVRWSFFSALLWIWRGPV